MVAELLELPLELVEVDLAGGAGRRPEYLALNLNGSVPTLDDDGFVLWESNAITQYLASKRPSSLCPSDPKARADVLRWQFWALAHWDSPTHTLALERVFKRLKGGEPNQAAIDRSLQSFHRLAAVLDRELAKRAYLAGDRLTVADLSVASGFTYAVLAAFPLERYEQVRRWLGTIEALAVWRHTTPPAIG
jgi:glutathione S-transferase